MWAALLCSRPDILAHNGRNIRVAAGRRNCLPLFRRLYIAHSRMDDELRLRLTRAPAGKTRRFREIGEGEKK
jgi:hypothetical protein